jgi:type IV pilus assembly protein PilV
VRVAAPPHGFSLIEILITLVVLSVGLLGLAALHAESLRSGRSAYLRTKAVSLASDMADRMRSNRPAALAGNYVSTMGDHGSNNDCADDKTGGATKACGPANMAKHDIWLWKTALEDPRNGLPGPGTGALTSNGAATPTYTIVVAWNDAGQASSYSVAVQP